MRWSRRPARRDERVAGPRSDLTRLRYRRAGAGALGSGRMRGRGRALIAGGTVAAVLAAAMLAAAIGVAPAGGRVQARPAASDCHAHVPPLLHDGFPEPPVLYS